MISPLSKAKTNTLTEKLKKTKAFSDSHNPFSVPGNIALAHLPCNYVDRTLVLIYAGSTDFSTFLLPPHKDTNPQIFKSETVSRLHCVLSVTSRRHMMLNAT